MGIGNNNWYVEHYMKRFGYCDCYECVEPEYRYGDNGHRFVQNNMKHHTFLEPCDSCDKPKTESRDLGRKGYYECWWCEKRTANTLEQNNEFYQKE